VTISKRVTGDTQSRFLAPITKTVSGSTTSYSYDYDEQLTQVASPLTGTSTFTYDGLGRRVSRTAGGVTTTFYYSGTNITTETQGANVVAHYVYGVNRVSRDASGSYEYYHNDGLGSTRQLSNDSQSVTQTTTFDAFGNIESSAGSSNNVYKYAGQWGYRNDGDDGLIHVGARYYDALVGRFVSADTYLGKIGNPQSLNRYVYVENDPVNAVDPTGRSPFWLLAVLVVVVVIGVGGCKGPPPVPPSNGDSPGSEFGLEPSSPESIDYATGEYKPSNN